MKQWIEISLKKQQEGQLYDIGVCKKTVCHSKLKLQYFLRSMQM